MILLEDFSRSLRGALLKKLEDLSVPLSLKAEDFDLGKIFITCGENLTLCTVALQLSCPVKTLEKCAVTEYVVKQIPGIVRIDEVPAGYDLAFQYDLEGAKEEQCTSLSRIRTVVAAAPFQAAFEAWESGEKFKPLRIATRTDESLYFYPSKDGLICCYSMVFFDKDELLFARQFLQEFADAKKHDRSLGGAPGVTFYGNKRPEVIEKGEEENEQTLWIELVIFASHVKSPKTIPLLLSFRTYVHYHLKCSKSFVHSRMRARAVEAVKVLNRAKTSATQQAEEKFV